MPGSGRKKASPGPRNPWNAQLDAAEQDLPTQAGEVDSGLEEGLGGGDKGRDADTGPGGYGGDAALMGLEEAAAQPSRPLTDEIHGDPRTPATESYPDEAKKVDPEQKPIGEAVASEDEDEDEIDLEVEEEDDDEERP
jgi:hypothetical protein